MTNRFQEPGVSCWVELPNRRGFKKIAQVDQAYEYLNVPVDETTPIDPSEAGNVDNMHIRTVRYRLVKDEGSQAIYEEVK